jgi:nucleotide-binding universal stress UspA family protein
VWVPSPDYFALPPAAISSRVAGSVAQLSQQTVAALKDAERLLRTVSKRIGADHPEWVVSTEFLRSDPASGLIEKAKDLRADLVIVGSSNRSALERIFLGSVSRQVVAETECSVRIALGCNRSTAETPLRWVVGVDGETTGELMAEHLLDRRWPHGSVVMLVTATSSADVDGITPIGQTIAAQETHSLIFDKLESSGLKLVSKIAEGEPTSLLLEMAATLSADCIAVGSRNIKGTLNQFILGSVSANIVAEGFCSVEVVRGQRSI